LSLVGAAVVSLVVVRVGLEREQVYRLPPELITPLLLEAEALGKMLLVALGEPMEVILYFLPLHLLVVAAVVRPALI